MSSKVEKSIEVEAPLQRVYNQWTQFEQFPQLPGSSRSSSSVTRRCIGSRRSPG